MKFVYSERCSARARTPTHTHARTHTYTHTHARSHTHTRAHACTRTQACAHMETDELKMEGKMERRTGGEDRETDSPEIIIKSQRYAGGR